MFWSKKVSCPIDNDDKELICNSFLWLRDSFGLEIIRYNEIVLPALKYFNYNFSGTERDAYYVYERVCQFMDIDVNAVDLKFYDKEYEPLVEGNTDESSSRYIQYSDGAVEIHLERSQLKNPSSLIATIAYELANYKLLGERRLTEVDELITELTAIVFGFGIFTANASVIKMEAAQDLIGSQWNINGGAGFMHYSLHGFTLALHSYYRKDINPNWVKYLESDIYKVYKKSIKYIEKNPEEFLLDL